MTNPDATERTRWNRLIATELRAIGLEAVVDETADGFLDDIRIEAGTLRYRPDAPCSNLLHEAGHLACIPASMRRHAHGDLSAVTRIMGNAFRRRVDETGDPDDPLVRAILQCSDPEATAWAWAFGVRVGVPAEMIILDAEYDGNGDSVRLQVSTGRHMGVHGLRHAGMLLSVRDYPHLCKWTQDAT